VPGEGSDVIGGLEGVGGNLVGGNLVGGNLVGGNLVAVVVHTDSHSAIVL